MTARRGFASDLPSKWNGSSDSNNWRKSGRGCAKVILAQNPNVIIMVEGIEAYPKRDTYASQIINYLRYNWGADNSAVQRITR